MLLQLEIARGLVKSNSAGRRLHPPLEVHILNDEIARQLSLAGCRVDTKSQSRNQLGR